MVKAVRQLDSGVSSELVAREYGVSRTTLYNWKSIYSGMDASQVKRLKELKEENRKLKQMYSDLALDNQILRDAYRERLSIIDTHTIVSNTYNSISYDSG